MNRLTFIITFLLVVTIANAQTFLDQLRTREAGKGRVSVMQAPEIDTLVNAKQKDLEKSGASLQHSGETDKIKDTPKTNTKVSHTTTSPTSDDETEDTPVDTRKKVMRNGYKMQGYRIQVFSGGNSRVDRQKAESAGAAMKNSFPSEPVYVHFYSPSWKCRMGNYRSVEEARKALERVKAMGYRQACIIKGPISVQK